ncbi:hypothetical protein BCR34DRAFT_597989 [Clohesyomyces aquaticus]|uniref:DUF8206 domain-containing protein n=1 Tax=Clohesyomyces aquaticus TaxID=1231657 RepID=A0A1Y2A0A3_9PLEO|nr:hypothetical protein BCR34DRAFT_597989 [Clohesyomyces aquaticus]
MRAVLESLFPLEEYNLLTLGETSVRKSTFINAFVNYMKVGSLEEPLEDEGPLQFAIPSEFSFDERRDPHDESFHLTFGLTYRFELEGKRFRLIDTLSIVDTQGIAQDREIVKDILHTLESVNKIHTVLLLFKPNRHFQIIVFVCTNARNTNFRFGDTWTPLETLLKDKTTGLMLRYHNSFFIDSEGFRYLAVKTLHNMVAGMTKPMVAIVSAIKATKAKHTHAKKKFGNLEADGCKLDDFRFDYVVPVRWNLKELQTVCSDSSCSKTVLVDSVIIKQYTQIYHNKCYISTQEETVGIPDLMECNAFGNVGKDCSVCGHAWPLHLHVIYRLDHESLIPPYQSQ